MGLTEVRNVIQVDSMDEPLRNRLWTLIWVFLDHDDLLMTDWRRPDLYRRIWLNYFERPGDELPTVTSRANAVLRDYVFSAEWFRVYDLLEFFLAEESLPDDVHKSANDLLERYLSGFRFVDRRLVPITDDAQITAVEDAVRHPLGSVRTHISKSLALLADRSSPDVENAMKEAISAVEALCSAIVGSRTTLGATLKKLEDAGVAIHPALVGAWNQVYGYTSDADGIRHALNSDSTATIDDALYFVVSCSSFVGLLTAKALGAGIELGQSED